VSDLSRLDDDEAPSLVTQLPAVLERGHEIRRRRIRLSSVAVVACLAILAGALTLSWLGGSRVPAGDNIAACGTLPSATSTLNQDTRVTLRAIDSAVSGTRIHLEVVVSTNRERLELATPPFPPVLIVRGDEVVGKYTGDVNSSGMVLSLTQARPAETPTSVLLSGCPTQQDSADPDGSRKPLPPGTYDLVAVLEDSGNGGSLISDRLSIQIS
jgi:hypothetical protein